MTIRIKDISSMLTYLLLFHIGWCRFNMNVTQLAVSLRISWRCRSLKNTHLNEILSFHCTFGRYDTIFVAFLIVLALKWSYDVFVSYNGYGVT